MRKPGTIERLYLDFDGFFASVEQQAHPRLRGRPVGVVPFEGTNHTCVIACSKEAKALRGPTMLNVYEYVVFANASVSDDVAYKVARAIHKNEKTLRASSPLWKTYDPKNIGKSYDGLKYHPGAARYFKEIGAQ